MAKSKKSVQLDVTVFANQVVEVTGTVVSQDGQQITLRHNRPRSRTKFQFTSIFLKDVLAIGQSEGETTVAYQAYTEYDTYSGSIEHNEETGQTTITSEDGDVYTVATANIREITADDDVETEAAPAKKGKAKAAAPAKKGKGKAAAEEEDEEQDEDEEQEEEEEEKPVKKGKGKAAAPAKKAGKKAAAKDEDENDDDDWED